MPFPVQGTGFPALLWRHLLPSHVEVGWVDVGTAFCSVTVPLFSCSSTPNHVVLINFNIWRTSLSSFLILSKKSPWSSVDFSNHVLLGFSLVFQIFLGFSSESSGRPSLGTNDTAFLPHSTHSYFRVLSTSGVWPPGRSGVFFLSCIQCWLTLFPL